MKNINWKVCITVSVIIAFVASFLSMTIGTPVDSDSEVMDLSRIDVSKFSEMNDEQFNNYLGSIPTKKLNGVERFTHQFSHPQIWWFYMQAVFTWFIGLLFATSIVSYLSNKAQNAQQSLPHIGVKNATHDEDNVQ